MTLLVCWVGVDTHGVASSYIAADSRVSWTPGEPYFDGGRKVYALSSSPDIFGYCGDVLFPSIVLGQIAEMADGGLLFSRKASCWERLDAVQSKLTQQFNRYPTQVSGIGSSQLQVLHVSREHNTGDFAAQLLIWERQSGWRLTKISMPKSSDVLVALGSGAKEFDANRVRYSAGATAGTSRNVFHCFCDTLRHTSDPACGGAPQLVGIYRRPGSKARSYGIITDRQRYFLGAKVDRHKYYEGVEWRNDLFELCDGKTKRRLTTAQSQPDPMRRP